MRTVSLFKNNNNQAIRIPRDMEFTGVDELEIMRDGDTLTLRPVRPSWSCLQNVPAADADFLIEREDIIDDHRFMDAFK